MTLPELAHRIRECPKLVLGALLVAAPGALTNVDVVVQETPSGIRFSFTASLDASRVPASMTPVEAGS